VPSKPKNKETRIDIRVTPSEQQIFSAAAEREHLTLSAWVRRLCFGEAATSCCKHGDLGEGPRMPLMHGSAKTEVCKGCGVWRDARNVGEHYRRSAKGFRPAAELLIDIATQHDE
jgi:hypothetical protein